MLSPVAPFLNETSSPKPSKHRAVSCILRPHFATEQRMYKTLSPWAIGVISPNTIAGIHAAHVGGFKGVEIDVGDIANLVEQRGADATRKLFTDAGVRPAGWGLPVD